MTQNLVNLPVDVDTLGRLDGGLMQMEAALEGLVSLMPEQRRGLTKMGEKSEAFCRAAFNVAQQYPGIMARDFDIAGFQQDLQTLDALRPRFLRIAHLHQRVIDTEMALGSDLMAASLHVYNALKVSGKGKGLDDAQHTLASRFRLSAREVEAGPADEGGD